MIDVFCRIAEISLRASVLTLAVLALRLLFGKAPKSWRCALWALVALRLLLPFSLQSSVSLQPDMTPVRESVEYALSAREEARRQAPDAAPEFTTRSVSEASAQPENPTKPAFFARADLPRLIVFTWLTGIAAAWSRAVVSYLLLRRKTAASLPLSDDVFLNVHYVKTRYDSPGEPVESFAVSAETGRLLTGQRADD